MIRKVLILNGPNLNLIGKREISIYGLKKINYINKYLFLKYLNRKFLFHIFQSNSENEILNFLQINFRFYNGLIINLASLSYNSYSLRDFIINLKIPVIEVHLSNISNRKEKFRSNSIVSSVSTGVCFGFGEYSYLIALEWYLYYFNLKFFL